MWIHGLYPDSNLLQKTNCFNRRDDGTHLSMDCVFDHIEELASIC